ncbi:alpha/beta-hydrolase [Rhizodiscina lignyota]|uniref:Alpha/beta-hydrolase n=1 Tax=Rhizodiscina lignyota TaxID=1504668 RepID=A0A9P4M4I3_9PEZI|nr:alpha/beta-hydrolase [Rhizodiscina lignyota]
MSQTTAQIALPTAVSLETVISTTSPDHPTLIFIHFWGGSKRTWSRLITQLQNDYNIIAPSQRGWGDSAAPKDPKAYGITSYAEDIVALIQHLQANKPELLTNGIILVGHSMGGKVAQYLVTEPEVACLLRGLILIAPAPSGSFSLPGEMREQQVHAYDSLQSASFVVRNVLLGKPDAVDDNSVAQLAIDAVAGSPEARVAWPEYGMAEDYEDAVVDAVRNVRDQLRILVVVGELDRVETAENIERRVVNVLKSAGAMTTVRVLGGIGHLIPVEAPEALASAIREFIVQDVP